MNVVAPLAEGRATNVVPEKAEFTVDLRLIPGLEPDDVPRPNWAAFLRR